MKRKTVAMCLALLGSMSCAPQDFQDNPQDSNQDVDVVQLAASRAEAPCPPPEAFAKGFSKDALVLRVSRVQLPVTGASACSAKVVDGETARVVTLDGAGRERDAEQLLESERVAARAKYGALQPELHAAILGADSSERVPVWIWARVHIPDADRQAAAKDPAVGEAHARAATAKAMAVLAPIEAELSRRGAEILDKDGMTPSVRALVTVADLRALAKMDQIMAIGSDEWPGHPTGTNWYTAIGAANAQAFATGAGQRVCVVEGSQPDDLSMLEIAACASPTGYRDSHTRWTAGIIRNTSSIEGAPAAEVFVGNWDRYVGTPTTPSPLQWCTSNYTRAINFSWSFSDGSPGGLSGTDLSMDYLAKLFPYPLFVQAAGNTGGDPTHATVNNRARNALVVGASDDMGTASVSDDAWAWFSSYKNPTTPHNDFELPNLVAPGVGVAAAGIDGSGTSAAAPVATGVAALIGSRNTTLDTWPEVKRAIMMATATEDVDGSAITRLPTGDVKDGAGQLNADQAVRLASPINWRGPGSAANQAGYNGLYVGSLSSISNGSYLTQVWNAYAPGSGRLRVVLALDGSASCNSNLSCSGGVLDADFDLEVKNSAGTVVCSSTTFDSSWELCDVPTSAGQTFQIRIRKYSNSSASTWLGLAWNYYYYP